MAWLPSLTFLTVIIQNDGNMAQAAIARHPVDVEIVPA
jgi:hypothetical protein